MILTIDPGINTGIAHFKTHDDKWPDVYEIRAGEKLGIEERLCDVSFKFDTMLSKINFNYKIKTTISSCYIESVEYWEQNLVSRTSAVRGNLSFLAYIVGVYSSVCFQHGIEVHLLPARQWKGQMDKDVTAERIRRINGITYKNSHITDAVGIGFALQGVL
jgi:hypothetical protein